MTESKIAKLPTLDESGRGTSMLDGAAANDATIGRPSAAPSEPESLAPVEPVLDDGAPLPAPDLTDGMYYGLAGDVMREASHGTEVHPAAVGMAFLSFAGVALGRHPCVQVGNDVHHPRIYTVHVGRSGIGGKGMALGLIKRIRLACENGANPEAPICGHFHDGGLSSREGLAWAIRDASAEDGKGGQPADPGVKDKRLYVVEEEFANVLVQSKRDGNTLSAALRTVWDGGDLAPLTKTSRTRATKPHIGIHACITPSELGKFLASHDLTNGFANRFLYVWAERQGVVPYPRSSPQATIDGFAIRLKEAIAFSRSCGEVKVSEDARAAFATFYLEHRQGLGLPPAVRNLIERHPPYAWRVALTFALLDCSDTITAAHMQAALAWLRYCRESVARIFSTASEDADAVEAGSLVPRILDALRSAGGQLNRVALRGAIGKPINRILDMALAQADIAGLIEATSTPREGGGRPTRAYSLKRRSAV